jgi:hypothetical protein
MTSIEGFSYATGHADFPTDHPEGMLDLVMTELAGLEDRVRIELFSKADRDREIFEICNELMDEMSSPLK